MTPSDDRPPRFSQAERAGRRRDRRRQRLEGHRGRGERVRRACPRAPLEEIPDSTIRRADGHCAHRRQVRLVRATRTSALRRQRQNFVFTREQQIQNVVDTDSLGCGVRALVDGTWGFAATRVLTKDGVAAAAREAVAIAKANRMARDRPVVLAPAPACPTDVEERLHDRSVHRLGRGEGVAAPQGQRRGAQGEGREVRLQRPLLREGGAQLRQHRRLGDQPDGRPHLAAHADHRRRRPTSAISRIAATSRAADGARLGVRARAGSRRQRPAMGRGGGRRSSPPSRWRSDATTSCCTRRTSGSRSTSRSAPHGARPRDGLRGQLRGHQLRVAAGEGARASSSTAPSS